MRSPLVNGQSRLLLWRRVREFAVPPSMIETATARRAVGDWAGACAAARVDVDLDLRLVARTRGREFAARLRADLRHLAPDLLRWHMPRVAPDGLLRPGLTVSLARYGAADDAARAGGRRVRGPAEPACGDALHLVVRTPPAWANAGQRISLALWDGGRAGPHPHPHPNRRFRLDLHPHLWDARRTGDLRERSGAATSTGAAPGVGAGAGVALGADAGVALGAGAGVAPGAGAGAGVALGAGAGVALGAGAGVALGAGAGVVLGKGLGAGRGVGADADAGAVTAVAVDRWAAEAALLLRAEGRTAGTVAVWLGGRRRALLDLAADGTMTPAPAGGRNSAWPVLPDAATWMLPDLALLRAGLIDAGGLHPLVATALVPGSDHDPADHDPPGLDPPGLGGAGLGPPGLGPAGVRDRPQATPTVGRAGGRRLVECRGARHEIGLRDGVLVALDHDPAELRRENALAAWGGPPLPCLRAIDEAHRHPENLVDVRARLDHGDTAGAIAVVEELLGPDALLGSGALREELEAAALGRVVHGLFRNGLAGLGPGPAARTPRRGFRTHPRHALPR